MAQFDLPLSQLEQYVLDVRDPADFDGWWTPTVDEARKAAAVVAVEPVEAHVERAPEVTEQHPWRELVDFLSVHREAVGTALRARSSVDGMNFTRQAGAPALFAIDLARGRRRRARAAPARLDAHGHALARRAAPFRGRLSAAAGPAESISRPLSPPLQRIPH